MQTRVHSPTSSSWGIYSVKEKTGQADKLSKNNSSYFAKVFMNFKKRQEQIWLWLFFKNLYYLYVF